MVKFATRRSSGLKIIIRAEWAKIDYSSEVKKKVQQKCADRVGCLFSIETTGRTIYFLAASELDAL